MVHYRNRILKGEKEGGINLNVEKPEKVRKKKRKRESGRGREKRRGEKRRGGYE